MLDVIYDIDWRQAAVSVALVWLLLHAFDAILRIAFARIFSSFGPVISFVATYSLLFLVLASAGHWYFRTNRYDLREGIVFAIFVVLALNCIYFVESAIRGYPWWESGMDAGLQAVLFLICCLYGPVRTRLTGGR